MPADPELPSMNETEAPTSLPTIVVQDGSPQRLLEAVEVVRRSQAIEAGTAPTIEAPSAITIVLSLAEVAVESVKALHIGGPAGAVASALDMFLDMTDAGAPDAPHAVYRALELLAQLVEAETQQGHPVIAAVAEHIRAVMMSLEN